MSEVIDRLWDEGYLFGGTNDESAEEIAAVIDRRWRTFERRHKTFKHPQLEDRQRDLIKGLQAQYDPTGLYIHRREWEGLVEAVSPILAAEAD